jgi:succinate dehydrogenase / fumarate reductase membrane anchor subunit
MSAGATDVSATRPAAWELPPRFPAEVENARSRIDYVLLRVTGLVLSVLVLGHFAVTHFVTDVARDDSTFVARRLSSGIWIAWDSTMLAAALAHGSVGVRLALSDYASGRRRSVLQGSLAVLAGGLFIVGAIAIARSAHV